MTACAAALVQEVHISRVKQATLCVAAPAARVAYIWNQWLKMSSMSSSRKQKYHCLFRMPSTAKRPAVESLHWAKG